MDEARLGIPTLASASTISSTPEETASCRSRPRGTRCASAPSGFLNAPTESIEGIGWMERGKEMEPQAVRQYEFHLDVETAKVGFITTDDGSMGRSPDRLGLSDRRIGLEVKCPSPHIHLGYPLNGQADE